MYFTDSGVLINQRMKEVDKAVPESMWQLLGTSYNTHSIHMLMHATLHFLYSQLHNFISPTACILITSIWHIIHHPSPPLVTITDITVSRGNYRMQPAVMIRVPSLVHLYLPRVIIIPL